MKTWKKEQPGEKLFFTLSLEQLRKAHEIYKRHCFCQDFLEHCVERRQDVIGLCNLPYDTLEEETELLHLAYELYEKWADMNTAYQVTLNCVIDEIEKALGSGTLHLPLDPTPRVVLVIEDGVITGSFTSEPSVRVEVIELSKEYASSEERDAVYTELESDPELSECDCRVTVPGYEDETESGEME